MSKRMSSGDVAWHLPGKRRPFATTTTATSDLVALLASTGATAQQARDQIRYDPDAARVLDYYIAHGYGTVTLTDIGVR